MRVVLDTNVFISGIFWSNNPCSKIITAWRENKFTLVSSFEIMEELTKVLNSFKIKLDSKDIADWRSTILDNSLMVSPKISLDIVKEDTADNKFFEVAIEANAEFIVSQDNHLLKIKEYKGIQVLTPLEFIRKAGTRIRTWE